MPSVYQKQRFYGKPDTGESAEARSKVMIARLDDALKNLGDRSALSRSPLARLDRVQGMAADRYSDKLMPRGLALRQVITEAVLRICAELGDEPGLAKPCRYLDLRAKGLKCTEVAAELGLTREHVSRTVRPKALGLLLEEFLSVTGRKD